MKKIFKKKIIIIGIILFIAIIIFILKFCILYKFYAVNYAWGEYHGYIYIFSNGLYIDYYNHSGEKNFKKAKISKEELKQLKNLAKNLEDKYEEDNSIRMNDAGQHTEKIFNRKKFRWILLREYRR